MAIDTKAWWYVDGQWVHPDQARISLNDMAVLRGYSAFEALRTYDRRPFHLAEHLQRLYHSAKLIDLELPYTQAEIARVVEETVERNTYRHAAVRMLLTGGESEDGVTASGQPRLIVMITHLDERDPARFARGYRLSTSRLQRDTPEAKTSNYTAAVRALKEVARLGADDALFVNERDHVQEATRSNFFIFHGTTLVTPREEVLLGITRAVVLDLARRRFTVEERPILLEELALVDEAFVTSSSKEITPVLQIDEQVIGSGQPGPHTTELEQLFIAMVERGEW
ncbi:MAG TPA: aminotransferase class IV [Ktedonobacteraceae bacterium]